MSLLEKLRNAGISDEDIITSFQFRAGGYSKTSKRTYSFGSNNHQEGHWANFYFNGDGQLYKIEPGPVLESEKSQVDLVNDILNDINGEHGYVISYRVLFAQRPLKGIFQWKNIFRIKPCLNNSYIGKGIAWGIDDPFAHDSDKHLGPPYPIILEVRTKKSTNRFIETNRTFEALDFYQWVIGLLIPHLLGAPVGKNGPPKWTMLQKENVPEYHLAYEAFNPHESDLETGNEFSKLDIPDAPRYMGDVEYYDHLWAQNAEIELPKDLEEYLHTLDKLPSEQKEHFRRSIYWFNTGSRLYGQDQLSILPFTIAIECLLPNQSKESCPSCNKPIGGPTKLFNEFMEKYLSLPDNIKYLKKSMYPIRSNMVHGNFSPASDLGFFSINKFDHSEMIFENFVRRSIINWLISGKLE